MYLAFFAGFQLLCSAIYEGLGADLAGKFSGAAIFRGQSGPLMSFCEGGLDSFLREFGFLSVFSNL